MLVNNAKNSCNCNLRRYPLSIIIDSGAEYNPYKFEETLGAIIVRTGHRPRTRPEEIVTDSIYDNTQVRKYLRSRIIKSSIPEKREILKREKEEDLKDLAKKLTINN